MFPETSGQLKRMAAPVIGLEPTLPVMTDGYTLVIPVFESIAKPAAVLKFTAVDFKIKGFILDEVVSEASSPEQLASKPAKDKIINGSKFLVFIGVCFLLKQHCCNKQRWHFVIRSCYVMCFISCKIPTLKSGCKLVE